MKTSKTKKQQQIGVELVGAEIEKCRPLKKGGRVGVFALSSPVDPIAFAAGLKMLEQLGYQVACPLDPSANWAAGNSFSEKNFFCCASAEARANSFMQLIEDESVDILIGARGGYGAIDVIPLLDFAKIKDAQKLIIGYSDLTILHAAIATKAKITSIHGPMIVPEFERYQNAFDAKNSVDTLLELASNPEFSASYDCKVLRKGTATGKLMACNLTMLVSLLGTPLDFDYSGMILALEDVGEAPYRIHRMLNQLRYAGKFENLGGIAFGRFSGVDPKSGPTIVQVIENLVNDILIDYSFPMLSKLNFGHAGENLPLPIGCEVQIESQTLSILESPVRPRQKLNTGN